MRYSEEQKEAATAYFQSESGTILSEEEKPSGNYVYQVKLFGRNERIKIDYDRLWVWKNWDWRPIPQANLPRRKREKSLAAEFAAANLVKEKDTMSSHS
ncbi:hypothetical protein ACYSNR_03130 [Enterococcus sp. LJL128]